jgi:hypothetical protein
MTGPDHIRIPLHIICAKFRPIIHLIQDSAAIFLAQSISLVLPSLHLAFVLKSVIRQTVEENRVEVFLWRAG